MKQLPDEQTLDKLIELAQDFEDKAKSLCELATEVDEKWRIRLAQKRQDAIQQSTSVTK